MAHANPNTLGVLQWRVRRTGTIFPDHYPAVVAEFGAWGLGNHPETGRVTKMFLVRERLEFRTVEEAEAALRKIIPDSGLSA
jgi:hypothetical protein